MESALQVQILDEAFWVSLHGDAFVKGMNWSFPSSYA